MNSDRITYLDSSAIVKLVIREPESAALRRYLQDRSSLVSSALARAEVSRAVLAFGLSAQRAAQEVLGRIDLLRVNNRILSIAGTLEPASLRTLDAIHLASALSLEDTLNDFVCYDHRLTQAAANQGWPVKNPA